MIGFEHRVRSTRLCNKTDPFLLMIVLPLVNSAMTSCSLTLWSLQASEWIRSAKNEVKSQCRTKLRCFFKSNWEKIECVSYNFFTLMMFSCVEQTLLSQIDTCEHLASNAFLSFKKLIKKYHNWPNACLQSDVTRWDLQLYLEITSYAKIYC